MRRILCASSLALILTPVLALADDFTLTGDNTKITFLGTKKGGQHDGGFKTLTGKASVDKNDLTTLKISVDIDTKSIYSDNEKVTSHLKTGDFFAVEANPKATFTSTKIEKAGDEYKITGDFMMLGKTKSITFPAKMSAGANGLSIDATFTIDRTDWGMKYSTAKVNKDVKLTVKLTAK